jgi:hypothetical protein
MLPGVCFHGRMVLTTFPQCLTKCCHIQRLSFRDKGQVKDRGSLPCLWDLLERSCPIEPVSVRSLDVNEETKP